MLLEKGSFYQDRLGTSIGRFRKRDVCFCRPGASINIAFSLDLLTRHKASVRSPIKLSPESPPMMSLSIDLSFSSRHKAVATHLVADIKHVYPYRPSTDTDFSDKTIN